MQETITLSRDTFARLLNSTFDVPGAFTDARFQRLLTAEFDLFWFLHHLPQVPPLVGAAARGSRAAMLAQGVIVGAVDKAQLIEALAAPEQRERAIAVIGHQIADVVDDWCGTRIPARPHPPKFGDVAWSPLELLVAGAQFQQAATTNHLLHSFLTEAADQLFTTGLKQLDSGI